MIDTKEVSRLSFTGFSRTEHDLSALSINSTAICVKPLSASTNPAHRVGPSFCPGTPRIADVFCHSLIGMDSFCIFLARELDKERQYSTPQQVDADKVVVIPHSYDTEEEYFKEDMVLLCKAYPVVTAAIESGECCTIDTTLSEILNAVPRKRPRVDAYARFQRYLQTHGITLNITSRKGGKKDEKRE